jgi:uncharacterized protein YajQ (UPF0234 family)
MPSFDIISKTDLQEVDNALNTARREIENRYDFKGSKSAFEKKEEDITILADDDYKLKAMQEILKTHMTRRKIDVRALDFTTPESAAGNSQRQVVKVKQGIEQEIAKKIVKTIKDSKLKVQASIQGDQLRVSAPKKDALQECIQLVRSMDVALPLQFTNYRD